jgi:hypothetical protein
MPSKPKAQGTTESEGLAYVWPPCFVTSEPASHYFLQFLYTPDDKAGRQLRKLAQATQPNKQRTRSLARTNHQTCECTNKYWSEVPKGYLGSGLLILAKPRRQRNGCIFKTLRGRVYVCGRAYVRANLGCGNLQLVEPTETA